ncbi:hypothetical protein C7T35_01315 [Variovorax sp. WS11]|nr:hypothetical protein [Variovorax sp. WS11]NDZ11508.1 hypothetical protein [Variovorax sp. WS11]PSL86636.1 hypothetical protein C7T35_01315 [Variovorax sp. WS11]
MAVVVGEDPDCLCNIGATLKVVEAIEVDGVPAMWRFVEESRPLKLCWCGEVTWSDRAQGYIADKYLVPWRNPDAPEADEVPAPGEAVSA